MVLVMLHSPARSLAPAVPMCELFSGSAPGINTGVLGVFACL